MALVLRIFTDKSPGIRKICVNSVPIIIRWELMDGFLLNHPARVYQEVWHSCNCLQKTLKILVLVSWFEKS
jgi:hypothetical protein